MVAVTYGIARVPAAAAGAKAAAVDAGTPRKSRLARFFDMLVEARMKQAAREIQRHSHLLPYSLYERGNRVVKIGFGDLPFRGR